MVNSLLESEEEDANNVKGIEDEAFTCALNLYFLTTDLPEIVNSTASSDQFHLMATHALFASLSICSALWDNYAYFLFTYWSAVTFKEAIQMQIGNDIKPQEAA